MGPPIIYFEAHNVAHALATMKPPSQCTTGAGVRWRVRNGRMFPDGVTLRGGVLWTVEGVARELAAEAVLQANG